MSASMRGVPDTSDMAAVHNVFRSLLVSAPELVAGAEADDARRVLIANYYDNVIAFLKAHHEGEDQLIYPVVMERAPDHREALALGRHQHEDVVPLMDAVTMCLASWQSDGDAQAPEVLRTLQALDDVLSPHLDHEEAEVVPVAAANLTIEEWGALPGHALGAFTGDKVWLIMGLVREQFTSEQRDAMLRNMPPPARQMWETVGESSFDALIAEVRQRS